MFVEINSNSDCGNYWSSPKNYFSKFNNYSQITLSDIGALNDVSFVIIRGEINKKELNEIESLKKKRADIKIIGWALGINHFDYTKDKQMLANISKSRVLKKNYFSDEIFELLGQRDFGMEFDFNWTPCASCLHPYFQKYKQITPDKKMGVYYNYNIFNIRGADKEDYMSNKGFDIEEKLKFICKYEFIITNSYHGVYWAQLLNRKVICLPVKYSLLNFRYAPFYLKKNQFRLTDFDDAIKLKKDVFENCRDTPDFLEESIEANQKFFDNIKQII